MPAIRYRTLISMIIGLVVALALTACATGADAPPETASAMTQQNECVKIADRSERDRCLEAAALGAGS